MHNFQVKNVPIPNEEPEQPAPKPAAKPPRAPGPRHDTIQ